MTSYLDTMYTYSAIRPTSFSGTVVHSSKLLINDVKPNHSLL